MEIIKKYQNHTIIVLLICLIIFIFARNEVYEYRPIVVANVTRALDTSYRPNITRYTLVSISTTITSTLGDLGAVTLQTSPNNSTWTTLETFTNNNIGIGIARTQVISSDMSAIIKPRDYYRFKTSGTSTFAILMGQETSL